MRRLVGRRPTITRAAIAVALGGALAFAAPGLPAGATGASRATAKVGQAKPNAIAKLVIQHDNVSVRAKGKKSFAAAKDGQDLHEGDTVKTDDTGKAEIDYSADAYTRLDVNTTFTIKKLTDDQGNRQVDGSLDTGRTWNRTVSLSESESFTQEGAGATAAVAGTAFAVDCDSTGHCTVTAVVDVTKYTGADGHTVNLDPLDACDATNGVLCQDITHLTPDQLSDWIQGNLYEDLILRGLGPGPITGTIVVQNGRATFTPTSGPTTEQSPPEPPPGPPGPPAPTAPGAPQNVSATAGNGQATVTFDPPASDGGRPITSYTVSELPVVTTAATGGPAATSAAGSGSPITVPGLTNGIIYTFTVTATNVAGTGPSSAPSNEVLPTAPSETPTATSIQLRLTAASLKADGTDHTKATATVQSGTIGLAGETVVFSSSDPGIAFSGEHDNGDGTYTTTITASTTPGRPTITATDGLLSDSHHLNLQRPNPSVSSAVTVSPTTASGTPLISSGPVSPRSTAHAPTSDPTTDPPQSSDPPPSSDPPASSDPPPSSDPPASSDPPTGSDATPPATDATPPSTDTTPPPAG